jgi:hypothetical protein
MIGGSQPRDSNFAAALASMCTHSYQPGVGYLQHDTPPVIHSGPAPAPLCDPPAGTRNGSRHTLAYGDKQMDFAWVEAERAWARHGGHRLAFTAEYLTREGWRYIGPAA